MAHRKPNLPEKICAACGRPFAWRKKWARNWEQVRHCSDACRGKRSQSAAAGGKRGGAGPGGGEPGTGRHSS